MTLENLLNTLGIDHLKKPRKKSKPDNEINLKYIKDKDKRSNSRYISIFSIHHIITYKASFNNYLMRNGYAGKYD